MRKFSFFLSFFILSVGIVAGDYVQRPYDSRPAPSNWDNAQSPDKSVWNYDAAPPPGPDAIGNNADMRITRVILVELARDNSLSSTAKQISVTTSKGIVTLRGTVQTVDEKNKLYDMVRKVYGVLGVQNQLNVPSAPPPKKLHLRPLTPEQQQKIDEANRIMEQMQEEQPGQAPGEGLVEPVVPVAPAPAAPR